MVCPALRTPLGGEVVGTGGLQGGDYPRCDFQSTCMCGPPRYAIDGMWKSFRQYSGPSLSTVLVSVDHTICRFTDPEIVNHRTLFVMLRLAMPFLCPGAPSRNIWKILPQCILRASQILVQPHGNFKEYQRQPCSQQC